MQIVLRRPNAEIEREFPEEYSTWRASIDELGGRDCDVAPDFGDLFLEQFWTCRDELYDVLQSQNVIAVSISLRPVTPNRVDVVLAAYQGLRLTRGPFLQPVVETLRGKKHPRQSDLLAACRRLKSLLHAHPNDHGY